MLKIKKKFNYRFFVITALSLMITIYFSMLCLKTILLKSLFLCFLIIVGGVLLFYLIKRKSKITIIAFSIALILLISSANLVIRQCDAEKYRDFDNSNVTISGRITSDYTYTSTDRVKLIIDNATLYGAKDVCDVDGKIVLYIEKTNLNLDKLKCGYNIEFDAILNLYSFSKMRDIRSLSSGIIGYTYCRAENIDVYQKSYIKLDERIRNYVYSKLKEFNIEQADVAYAMFFGKTAVIDSDINKIFLESGTSHILAVSGMHISIIIAIAHFVIKKLKVKPSIELCVLLLVLPFYNYLCDYSASVLRASIMGIIAVWASMRRKKYDRFSSLGFTATIILFINPLLLFNYSFILSFANIFAFVLLYRPIKKVLKKIFYNRFASSVAMCLCSQIGLVFITMYLFGTFSPISFFANLIIIPLTTIAFEILLIMFPLVLLFNPLQFILKIFDFLIISSVRFGNYLISLGLFYSNCFISVVTPVLYFALIYILSDYLFETKKNKAILSLFAVICSVIAYSLLLL